MKSRASHTEYMRQWRKKKQDDFKAGKSTAEHGKRSTHDNYGCRCEPCLLAHRASQEERAATRSHSEHLGSSYKSRNRIPLHCAPRRRQEWTSADMSLAAEVDSKGNYLRTSFEVAQITGRTIMGVQRKRSKMLVRQDQREAAGNPYGKKP